MKFSLPITPLKPFEPRPHERNLLAARLTGNHYEMGQLERRLGHTVSKKLSDSGAYANFRAYKERVTAARREEKTWEKLVIISGIVFVHIPKAAGTSVCQAIYGGKAGDHRSIRDYQCVFTRSQLEVLQIITVTRDPVSRFRSAFHYLKEGGRNKHDQVTNEFFLANTETAYDFAIKCCDEPLLLNLLHFRPQTGFLETSKQTTSERIQVLRVEESHELQRHLRKIKGEKITLPKHNKGSMHTVVTSERKLRAVVEQLYPQDFCKLGY